MKGSDVSRTQRPVLVVALAATGATDAVGTAVISVVLTLHQCLLVTSQRRYS